MEERRDRRQQKRDDKYERRLADEQFWADFEEQIDADRTEAYAEDRRREEEKKAAEGEKKEAAAKAGTHAAADGTTIPIDAPWRNGPQVGTGVPQRNGTPQGKEKAPYVRVWDRAFAPMGQALREPFEGLPDPRQSIRRAARRAADAAREGTAGLRAAARPFVPEQATVPPVQAVAGTGLPAMPSVVPRRPSVPVRLDQLRQPTRPAGGHMFGIADAAQSLAAFNPDEPTEMKSALMSLPGEMRDLGAGIAALAENIAANYPYAPAVADTLRELGAAVSATEQGAEDAAMAFVREHEVDLNRHEAPRANEQHWNVRG